MARNPASYVSSLTLCDEMNVRRVHKSNCESHDMMVDSLYFGRQLVFGVFLRIARGKI